MPTLHLLRHAKPSSADASMRDFDCPLASRGVEDCAFIGDYIKEKGIDFDLVLVSTAVRTRETIKLVRERAEFTVRCDTTSAFMKPRRRNSSKSFRRLIMIGKAFCWLDTIPVFQDLLAVLTGEHVSVSTATLAKID